jgi:hypothetical protein
MSVCLTLGHCDAVTPTYDILEAAEYESSFEEHDTRTLFSE